MSSFKVRDIARSFKDDIILVASDKRLIIAAKCEDIIVIDPEVESRDGIRKLIEG